MESGCTFLMFKVVFLLGIREAKDSPTRLPAASCVLNSEGDHPWLIRITAMKDIPQKTKPNNGELTRFNDKKEETQCYATQVKENLYDQFRRGNHPNEPSGGVEPGAAVSGPPASLGEQNYPTEEQQPEIGHVKAGVSIMHGALISTRKVLTTTYINDQLMIAAPMDPGLVSLIGYNTEKKCMQEQWGQDVIRYHGNTSRNTLDVGQFAIIQSHQDFLVEGDPFLFGPSGLPPFPDIIGAYNDLIGKGDAAMVTMYLFKDNKTLKDGSTYDEATTKFKFIPWRLCQEMPSLMLAGAEGMSPDVTPETFFCSKSIPGIMNVPITGETSSGFDSDWYQGAPVVYKTEAEHTIPLGHYVYRVGKSGDPRIYATYTSMLSTWLMDPSLQGSRMLPPEGPVDIGVGSPSGERQGKSDGTPVTRRSSVKPESPMRTSRGSHVTLAELWVVMTCTFASTNYFAYK